MVLFVLVLSIFGCQRDEFPTPVDDNVDNNLIENFDVPDGFQYETIKDISLVISAMDNQGQPLTNVPVEVLIPRNGVYATAINGWIGEDGVFESDLVLDVNTEMIMINTPFVGLPDSNIVYINKPVLSYVLGAQNNQNLVVPIPKPDIIQPPATTKINDLDFGYFGGYNSNGVPANLVVPGDVITADQLAMINASLPNGAPVPINNPEYIANGTSANTNLDALADVWITFVHEGAGFRNALGFYTYPTNNPPSSVDDIDNFQIIFPNSSYSGSGGGLTSGDKVYLGQFPANTSIGWFLVPNGWNSSIQQVDPRNGYDYHIKFSDKNLNDFAPSDQQSHTVLLVDEARELLLLGMEDISRPGGDRDFNDAIFYVTANPFTAINTANLPETTNSAPDSDGDGIPDIYDNNNEDPDVAFESYYPAENQYNSLAFEDFWPKQGDYDMNDMVVDYSMIEQRGANNKVVRLRTKVKIKAMGAGYRSGLGFELPLPSSRISSVSGNSITESYITMGVNGAEAGQTNATIIMFDNGFGVMSAPGGGFVNTEDGEAFITPVELTVDANFVEGVQSSFIGSAPFNPFLIAGMSRGHEIHLPGGAPTDKANLALFGTQDDDSNPSTGKYYLTANNLPWGVNLATPFSYPKEKEPINSAYLKFKDWSESGGSSFTDWFSNSGGGYRNSSKLYSN